MSIWDTVMSDTVGTVYRAATGKVDPWTQNEINAQGTSDCVSAGGDPATCQQQTQQTTQQVLNSQTTTWWQAFNQSFGTDNGSGCGFSNPGGCMPFDPTWLPYILAGAGVLALLWLIRPFVIAAEE